MTLGCGWALRRSGWGLRDALKQSALTALARSWPLLGTDLTIELLCIAAVSKVMCHC